MSTLQYLGTLFCVLGLALWLAEPLVNLMVRLGAE